MNLHWRTTTQWRLMSLQNCKSTVVTSPWRREIVVVVLPVGINYDKRRSVAVKYAWKINTVQYCRMESGRICKSKFYFTSLKSLYNNLVGFILNWECKRHCKEHIHSWCVQNLFRRMQQLLDCRKYHWPSLTFVTSLPPRSFPSVSSSVGQTSFPPLPACNSSVD